MAPRRPPAGRVRALRALPGDATRGGAAATCEAIERHGAWAIPALLALATGLAFLPALENGFVGDWDDSQNLIENPNYRGLGWSQIHWMFEQGRVDEAVRHYETALAIAPAYPEAQFNLGLALLGQGRQHEAIPHLRQALALGPAPETRRALDRALAESRLLRSSGAAGPPGR